MNTTWSFSNEHLQCLADSPCAPFLEELDLSRTSIATGCARQKVHLHSLLVDVTSLA